MEITKTEIDGAYLLQPKMIGDHRGWFMESYRADKMQSMGLVTDYVQDNHSFSMGQGTVRGLHFQKFPRAQTKLIRCTRGAILDVIVDLRKDSPTYKKHIAIELSAENKRQLYIPRGCAHGFLTLSEDCEIQYKVDDYYSAANDRSIRFDDPELGIDWGVTNPVLSDKDKNAPLLRDSDHNFGARILVTGGDGQLGQDVIKHLSAKGIPCKGADRKDFDITDAAATDAFVKAYKPTVIIHCAAYTAVDKAETEREICHKINVDGSSNIAKSAAAVDAAVVYISSDYVYGGMGDAPLCEDSPVSPLNHYGQTKLLGERAVQAATSKHFILRTSWVFGRQGNNFVKTMRRLFAEGKSITVVDDQIGSPTYTVDLAAAIAEIMFSDKYGVYNVSNEGFCSWAEFADLILGSPVGRTKTAGYNFAAARPLNSRLSKDKLQQNGFSRLPSWQNALDRYNKE